MSPLDTLLLWAGAKDQHYLEDVVRAAKRRYAAETGAAQSDGGES